MADGPLTVMQHAAGQAVTGRSERHGRIEAHPGTNGLPIKMDGQVEIRKQPAARGYSHRNTVRRVDKSNERRVWARWFRVNEVCGGGQPRCRSAGTLWGNGAHIEGLDVAA